MSASASAVTVGAAEVALSTMLVAAGATYERRPPAFANPDLLDPGDRQALESRWHEQRQAAPPILLWRLPEALASFPGILRLADGRVVAESLHNMTAARRAAAIAAAPRGAEARIEGATLLMARAGSSNYGHWLVEHLGALLLLGEATPALAPRLVVGVERGQAMFRVDADSARLAGLPHPRLHSLRRAVLRLPELRMFSPASDHPHMKHPAAIAALARLAPAREATGLLFVRRTSTTKRVLRNLAEVEAAARGMGFRVIEPGRMTLAEQIETFAGARVVVGVSGADLTNIVFMPPGGEVVCLLPARGRNLFFWDLCCHRRHRYWSVFGPPVTERGGGHDDFVVDAALAAGIIARAVSDR